MGPGPYLLVPLSAVSYMSLLDVAITRRDAPMENRHHS